MTPGASLLMVLFLSIWLCGPVISRGREKGKLQFGKRIFVSGAPTIPPTVLPRTPMQIIKKGFWI